MFNNILKWVFSFIFFAVILTTINWDGITNNAQIKFKESIKSWCLDSSS